MFAVLVDGSNKSMHALKLAIKMMGPNDKIKTVSAAQANIDIAKVKMTVEHDLEAAGVLDRSEVKILDSNPAQTVKETIREYLVSSVEEDYIDFVFVGN